MRLNEKTTQNQSKYALQREVEEVVEPSDNNQKEKITLPKENNKADKVETAEKLNFMDKVIKVISLLML